MRSAKKPEGPLLTDKQLVRAMVRESELKESALKEDVSRLRVAATQLERLISYLEGLNDEHVRSGLKFDLSEMADNLSNLAHVKVREVQELVLARNDMTRRDLGRLGGQFRGGTSTKGWGP